MWRQKLYAFLLRRILGPFLTAESNAKLSQCIEVTFQEGRFVLKDVYLDPSYLTNLISSGLPPSSSGHVAILQAKVRRLSIHLSLNGGNGEHDELLGRQAGLQTQSAGSMMRNVLKMGYWPDDNDNGSGMKLLAEIEIEGVEIDFAPSSARAANASSAANEPRNGGTTQNNVDTKSNGFFSSVVDAALASLRLNIKVSDIHFRVFDSSSSSISPRYCVGIRLSTASYRDLTPLSATRGSSLKQFDASAGGLNASGKMRESGTVEWHEAYRDDTHDSTEVLHKAIDFCGLSIEVASMNEESEISRNDSARRSSPRAESFRMKVAQTEGTGQIRVRVVASSDSSSDTDGEEVHEKIHTNQSSHAQTKPLMLQHDVEVSLHQHISLSFDVEGIKAILTVLYGITDVLGDKNEKHESVPAFSISSNNHVNNFEGPYRNGVKFKNRGNARTKQEDRQAKTLDGIMQQYAEARHLARTKEVRGGILIPSSFCDYDDNEYATLGGDVPSFDAFFDCNSTSFSHYMSMVQSTQTSSAGGMKSSVIHTKIKFHLLESSIKLLFDENGICEHPELRKSDANVSISSSSARSGKSIEKAREHVLVSISDLYVTASLSESQSLMSMDLSHFEVEDSIFLKTKNTSKTRQTDMGSLLRFVEDTTEVDSFVVAAPPCISVSVQSIRSGTVHKSNVKSAKPSSKNVTETTVEIRLQQIELMPRFSTLSNLKQVANSLTSFAERKGNSGADSRDVSSQSANVFCACPKIVLLFPIDEDAIEPAMFDGLFARCSRRLYNTTHFIPMLGLALDIVSFEISSQPPRNNEFSSSSSYAMSCQNATIFVAAPSDEIGRSLLAMEIAACSGEPAVSPDSLVKLRYSCPGSSDDVIPFPLVPPLSSVKARQESDSDDPVRAEDPQAAMAREAETCRSILEVDLPLGVVDMTVQERLAFASVLSALGWDDGRNGGDGEEEETGAGGAGRFGLALNCDQAILILHEEDDYRSSCSQNVHSRASFVTIADGLKTFSVLGAGEGMRNCRVFSRDLTLYEATSSYQTETFDGLLSRNGTGTFDVINAKKLKIRGLSGLICAKPVFHRSNLSHPLSPETPAFQIDVLNEENEDLCCDRTVHVSIYDMTYRYALESSWFSRFVAVLKGYRVADSICEENGARESVSEADEESDAASSLTRLFVTFSDCILDYTPSFELRRDSRAMIRFGEIHISSNLVSDAPVQAYKASLADLAVHLCNNRFPYNAENSRLSCSRSILDFDYVDGTRLPPTLNSLRRASLEDVLDAMNFVSVANLDSCDAFVKVNTGIETNEFSSSSLPGVVLHLTLGQLSLFVCRDSFRCLTDTYDEWFLKFTAPPVDEISSLRETSAPSIRVESNEVRSKEEITSNERSDNIVKGALATKERRTNVSLNEIEHTTLLNEDDAEEPEVTLFDVIEENMFTNNAPGITKSTSVASNPTPPTTEQHEGKNTPFANIPDSELSATELRKKHAVTVTDDVASNLAKSLLIKNFYTVETTSNDQREIRVETKNNAKHQQQYHRSEDERPVPKTSLDGYDWTTVDYNWARDSRVSSREEQKAMWFTDDDDDDEEEVPSKTNAPNGDHNKSSPPRLRIFPQHVPVSQQSEFLSETGDMNASKFAGTSEPPRVRMRVLLHDLSVNCRFFDGWDWTATTTQPFSSSPSQTTRSRRDELLDELLDEDFLLETTDILPPPYTANPQGAKKNRDSCTFFQCSIQGAKLRMDSFEESSQHRLASCMRLSLHNLFVAETISEKRPKKMLGEWVNDIKHPRDSNDGMLMMKMVTLHPTSKLSSDGKLMSDESSVLLQLLPLRCHIDQSAMRFIRNFFSSVDDDTAADENDDDDLSSSSKDEIVGTFFRQFKIKPCKLKVNYHPVGMDLQSLREGSYAELLNLFSLEDMELTLQTVILQNLIGWGDALGEMLRRWIEDICQTQMHKFLTGAVPFHSISAVGGEMIDLVFLPVHHYKHPRRPQGMFREIRTGTRSFAGTLALETLNTTSKLTRQFANALHNTSPNCCIPSRPSEAPHTLKDAAGHALESLSKGIRTANYTVWVVPKRDYERYGTTGAFKSFVKAIPVAVLAPLGGASEALSYTLLGARNQLRPDICREEEALLGGV